MITELRLQIRDLVRPWALKYGLTVLPESADIVVIAWLFFTALQYSLSPAFSRVLFPVSYGKADKRTRKNWDMHAVSFIHAIVAVVLASRCLHIQSLDADRAFGTYPDTTFLLAIAVGYFIWDAIECTIHFTEIGFVVHGVGCLVIFLLGTRPFVHYYAVRFLLWEVSTIFLNINWYLDKTGNTGSQLQWINGMILLGTFFCFRIVWGAKISYDFFVTLNGVHTKLPLFYIMVYGVSNIVLQGLNWFWFTKMITAIQKRFRPSVKDKSSGRGILNGNGTGKIESHRD